MIPTRRTVLARIMDKVERDPATGCWIYTGQWDTRGAAGVVKVGKRQYFVRKVMAWIKRRCQLWDELVAYRICKSEACCNPRHIRVGTREIAMSELFRRKVRAKARPRLTEGRLRCILTLLRSGSTLDSISEEIGVPPESIKRAIDERRRKRRRKRDQTKSLVS